MKVYLPVGLRPLRVGFLVLLPTLLATQVVGASAWQPSRSSPGAPSALQASQNPASIVSGAPTAPSGLSAIALSINQVYVSWSRPGASSASGPGTAIKSYALSRDGKKIAEVLADGSAPLSAPTFSYVDSGVKPSTTYGYAVEAVDAAGRESQPSRLVRVKTPDPPETADTEAPTNEEGLSAVLTADGNVLLDWYSAHDDTDITAYKISRNNELITVLNHGAQRYIDTTIRARSLKVIKVIENDSDRQEGPDADSQSNDTPNGPNIYTYSIVAQDVVGKTSQPEEIVLELDGAVPVTGTAAQEAPASNSPATSAAPTTYSSQLRRYPYLTDLVQKYATINWATDRSGSTGSVRWGQVADDGSCSATNTVTATKNNLTVNSVSEYQWKAQLILTPNTQYCYRAFLGSVDLLGSDPSPRFWTQIPAGAPDAYSFAVIGDWGAVDINGANPQQAGVMQQIATSGARFALTVGDNGYPSGSQNNYGDLQQIGADTGVVFGADFWARAGSSIALFPAMGNHGRTSSSTLHPHLLNWPEDEAVSTSSGRYARETYCCLNGTTSAQYPSTWYAFDAGVARFYVLDVSWSDGNVGTADVYTNDHDYHWLPTTDEYQWLQNDLATHPGGLKFAFFHFPIYSANASEASDPWLQGSTNLEGLLSQYGVNIGFFGHAHIYERNLPANSNSLITYLTGGGGAKLEPVSRCSPPTAYAIGWSYSANGGLGRGSACAAAPLPPSLDHVFHFLLVTVNGTQVTVAPTDSVGRTFDVQTYQFGSGSTPVPTNSPTGTPTGVPTNTVTSTPTDVPTSVPTSTSTPTATATSTPTAQASATSTPVVPTPTSSATPTPVVPTPTSSATPTPGNTFTLVPIADTYADSVHSDTNYRTATSLHIDYPTLNSTEPIQFSYMKFDLSSLAGRTVASATLRIWVTNISHGTMNLKTTGTDWQENTLTYNLLPPDLTTLTTFVADVANSWNEVNVTSAVAAGVGGPLSLRVDSTSTDGMDFSSRETTNKPQLVVTTAP